MLHYIWGSGGGKALFDIYSFQHIVWFIAITILLVPIFKNKVWRAVIALAFVWEVFEFWVVDHFKTFPFAGKEQFINKVIGDPICDFIGFFIAYSVIKSIRENKDE